MEASRESETSIKLDHHMHEGRDWGLTQLIARDSVQFGGCLTCVRGARGSVSGVGRRTGSWVNEQSGSMLRFYRHSANGMRASLRASRGEAVGAQNLQYVCARVDCPR